MGRASRRPAPGPPGGRPVTLGARGWGRRLTASAVAALAIAAGTPAAAGAQARGVDISLPAPPARATEGPLVRLVGVLERREVRDLLDHNFPLRLHYRAELWSTAGWFDALRGTSEWDVVVRRDPLDRSYQVARLAGDQVTLLGDFPTRAEAVRAAERPYRVPLLPRGRSRQYYTVKVEIEAMSLNDLDEVEQWLRGEFRPAVRGERNPGTALGRGVRTLAVRLLGSETAEYRARTTAFRP